MSKHRHLANPLTTDLSATLRQEGSGVLVASALQVARAPSGHVRLMMLDEQGRGFALLEISPENVMAAAQQMADVALRAIDSRPITSTRPQ